MKQYNRVYAKIDLDAIAYNMEQMKKRFGGDAQLIAVVKQMDMVMVRYRLQRCLKIQSVCLGVCNGKS